MACRGDLLNPILIYADGHLIDTISFRWAQNVMTLLAVKNRKLIRLKQGRVVIVKNGDFVHSKSF